VRHRLYYFRRDLRYSRRAQAAILSVLILVICLLAAGAVTLRPGAAGPAAVAPSAESGHTDVSALVRNRHGVIDADTSACQKAVATADAFMRQHPISTLVPMSDTDRSWATVRAAVDRLCTPAARSEFDGSTVAAWRAANSAQPD
jgi:hypothetical protein